MKNKIIILSIMLLSYIQLLYADIIGSSKIKDIYKKVGNAVVYIDSVQYIKTRRAPLFSDPFFNNFFKDMFGDDLDLFFGSPHYNNVIPRKGQGSGFIFDKRGYIFTNEHVIDNADEITVTLADGRKYKAKVVGMDREFDVAILKIDVKDDLPVIKLGDSSKTEVGEWVIAIGNPFGLEQTVTVGVISALGRNLAVSKEHIYTDLIQTDASINPGNSGGPLINMKGEAIGINSAIIPYGQGLGFAIPINRVKRIFNDIIKYGEVKRPWLGVYIQDLDENLKNYFKVDFGVLISDVVKNSAAEKAGLKRGDIIIRYNGKKIKDTKTLQALVKDSEIDQKVFITIIRKGKELVLPVMLTEKNGTLFNGLKRRFKNIFVRDNVRIIREKLGIDVEELTASKRLKLGLKENHGVYISKVYNSGFAGEFGLLSVGDVILEINGKKIHSTKQLASILKNITNNSIIMVIYSNGYTKYVSVKIGK